MTNFKNEETGASKNFKKGMVGFLDEIKDQLINEFDYLKEKEVKSEGAIKLIKKTGRDVNAFNCFSILPMIDNKKDLISFFELINFDSDYLEKIVSGLNSNSPFVFERLYLAGVYVKMVEIRNKMSEEDKTLASKTSETFKRNPVFQRAMVFAENIYRGIN